MSTPLLTSTAASGIAVAPRHRAAARAPQPVKLPAAVRRGMARQYRALGLAGSAPGAAGAEIGRLDAGVGSARLDAGVESARFDAGVESARFDAGVEPARLDAALAATRAELRREGLADETVGAALALVAIALRQTLGKTPYPTQWLAAWLMLRGRLAEMATGEGKTIAAALASAVGALSGVTVHVLTANDYLVERDQSLLEPFYRRLGLGSAVVLPAHRREQRAAAYRCDVVHVTARELVFDYLNDHLRLAGEREPQVLRARALARGDLPVESVTSEPVLPSLSFALIDEADSILLDEACVPLVLSRPGPDLDGDSLARAFTLARGLADAEDFRIDAERRLATLTERGRERIAAAVAGASGMLRPARRAFELVESALVGLHVFRRDREYAVVRGELVLIDEVTGRVAEGRRWNGILHSMVEIKEGLAPQAPAVTAAQMTYQRFFDRYEHLCGMSGTLLDSRAELKKTYGLRIARVPLARSSRRRWFGERLLATRELKWRAVVSRVRAFGRRGRPVLIGTESVAASMQLSTQLDRAGIAHAVLNAVQTRDEAELVARAGRAGAVTVATNIAGRGTDIELDASARAAGGLHVIATMRNRSRRIDRQLIGRGARQGDPGSAESIIALDDSLLANAWPPRLRDWAARTAGAGVLPAPLATVIVQVAQRRAEAQDRVRRQRLRLVEDRQAETFGWFGGTE